MYRLTVCALVHLQHSHMQRSVLYMGYCAMWTVLSSTLACGV